MSVSWDFVEEFYEKSTSKILVPSVKKRQPDRRTLSQTIPLLLHDILWQLEYFGVYWRSQENVCNWALT